MKHNDDNLNEYFKTLLKQNSILRFEQEFKFEQEFDDETVIYKNKFDYKSLYYNSYNFNLTIDQIFENIENHKYKIFKGFETYPWEHQKRIIDFIIDNDDINISFLMYDLKEKKLFPRRKFETEIMSKLSKYKTLHEFDEYTIKTIDQMLT